MSQIITAADYKTVETQWIEEVYSNEERRKCSLISLSFATHKNHNGYNTPLPIVNEIKK
jgi:predicted ABC-class ATPase